MASYRYTVCPFFLSCLASGLCTGRANKSYLGDVVRATRISLASYTHVHTPTHPRRPLSAWPPSFCNGRRHHSTPLVTPVFRQVGAHSRDAILLPCATRVSPPRPYSFRLVQCFVLSRFHFRVARRRRTHFSTLLDS